MWTFETWMLYLGFNYEACPKFISASFHNSFQDYQPKTPNYVHYFKIKYIVSAKHLQQKYILILLLRFTYKYMAKKLDAIKWVGHGWVEYLLTSISIWPGSPRSSTIKGQAIIWFPNSQAHVTPLVLVSLEMTPLCWLKYSSHVKTMVLNITVQKSNATTEHDFIHLSFIGFFYFVCLFCYTLQEKHVLDGPIQQTIDTHLSNPKTQLATLLKSFWLFKWN